MDFLVAIDVFLRRLIGRVRRVKGQIKIERFVGILRIDVFHRILAYELGCVAFLAGGLVVAEPVEHAVLLMREIIQFADHSAVLVVKAALLGPILLVCVPKMPLTDDSCVVAGLFQALRHQPFGGVQPVRSGRGNDYRLQTIAERIPAGH